MFQNLPVNKLLQFQNGRWGFVGAVTVALNYRRKDGKPVTERDAYNANLVGPNAAGLEAVAWETKEEALAAAAELGVEVTR